MPHRPGPADGRRAESLPATVTPSSALSRPTETRRCANHVTSSGPVLTTDRGAGTRQAPWRQASHISSQEASKATDRPARPGPRAPADHRAGTASPRHRRTPLHCGGSRPHPWGCRSCQVKMTHASSLAPGGGRQHRSAAPPARSITTVADDDADARCGPHQFGTVVRVIHVDGHVGRPDRQHGEDGQVKLCTTGTDPGYRPGRPRLYPARPVGHRLAAPGEAGPGNPAPTGRRQSR